MSKGVKADISSMQTTLVEGVETDTRGVKPRLLLLDEELLLLLDEELLLLIDEELLLLLDEELLLLLDEELLLLLDEELLLLLDAELLLLLDEELLLLLDEELLLLMGPAGSWRSICPPAMAAAAFSFPAGVYVCMKMYVCVSAQERLLLLLLLLCTHSIKRICVYVCLKIWCNIRGGKTCREF
jgi:hypothetical protein